jgi:hypothetical protein
VKKTKTIGYLFMLNSSPRYVAEVVKQEATETTKHQGAIPIKTRIRVADEANARTSTGSPFTAKELILTQTQVSYVSEVKFVEGPWKDKTLTISNDSLNP